MQQHDGRPVAAFGWDRGGEDARTGVPGSTRTGFPVGRRGRRQPRRAMLGAAVVAGGALTLAACGGSASTSSLAVAAGARSGVSSSGAPKAPPGVSGTVAAVDTAASNMEVQNPTSGQTTVTWTASTSFTQTVDTDLASVAAGDCVVATGTPPAGAGSAPTTVTATSVAISAPPASGSCTRAPAAGASSGSSGAGRFGRFGGFAGAGGFGAGGAAFRRGSSGSTGTSSSTPRTVATAFGEVTGVSGSTITIAGHALAITITPGKRPARGTFRRRTSSSAASAPPATTVTIVTTSSTTFRQTASASASALAVGQCVTARGPSSSNGAITATAIAITPPGPSGCFAGFGDRGSAAAGPSSSAG